MSGSMSHGCSSSSLVRCPVADKIQKKHQIQVSEVKVRRAKKLANDKKDGDFIQQYGMLRAYLEQLVKANPGSHVKVDVEPCHDPNCSSRQFRRVYICYAATKRGFQMLGREILGLDGCFMKGQFPGQLLTSVSIDGNRCIYPLAFALVEAETLHSWTWFLECLRDSLDLPTNANFTFISDRQKVNSIRSQCVVNVKYRTCTCRKWDLTAMPCKHAVAAINDMAINNLNVGIPEQWVSETYWLDTWKKVYDNQIMPIPSED